MPLRLFHTTFLAFNLVSITAAASSCDSAAQEACREAHKESCFGGAMPTVLINECKFIACQNDDTRFERVRRLFARLRQNREHLCRYVRAVELFPECSIHLSPSAYHTDVSECRTSTTPSKVRAMVLRLHLGHLTRHLNAHVKYRWCCSLTAQARSDHQTLSKWITNICVMYKTRTS